MAGVTSLSLLRNCAATTVRAFVTVKASNPSFKALLCPLQSQRSLSCVRATSNEETAAKVAAANADSGSPTMYRPSHPKTGLLREDLKAIRFSPIFRFDKIIAKEIPSSIVYEDDKVLAFRDINPQAPVHVVIIPKNRDGLTELGKAESRHVEILGQLMYAAKIVAEKEGILHGFRVVINNGPDGCQSVYHLHLHLLGGRQMKWPPG